MAYLGYEILLDQVTEVNKPSINIIGNFENFGKLSTKRQILTISETIDGQQFTFVQENDEDRYNLRLFFNTVKGRKNPFWLPSWKTDFKLSQTNAGASLYIENDKYTEYFENLTDMHIIFRDGYDHPTKIVSIAEVDEDEEFLVVDSVPASGLPLDSEIGFLYFVRFNQDNLIFEHVENEKSLCTLTFKELREEMP